MYAYIIVSLLPSFCAGASSLLAPAGIPPAAPLSPFSPCPAASPLHSFCTQEPDIADKIKNIRVHMHIKLITYRP